jgi:hypothetical protein
VVSNVEGTVDSTHSLTIQIQQEKQNQLKKNIRNDQLSLQNYPLIGSFPSTSLMSEWLRNNWMCFIQLSSVHEETNKCISNTFAYQKPSRSYMFRLV